MAHSRSPLIVVVGVVAAAAVAACGSGSGDGPPALRVAYQAAATSTASTYVAQDQGFFTEEGVTVEITDNVGTSTVTALISSGEADIVFTSMPTALQVAGGGKATSIIRTRTGGAVGGSLAVNQDRARTVEDLRALGPDCTIASGQPGASVYGAATRWLVALDLGNCTLSTFGDARLAVASAAAGRDAAVVSSYSLLATSLEAGQLTLLFDTSDPAVRQQYLGGDTAEGGEWGLTENLREKRATVVAYERALDRATEWIAGHSDADVAQVLTRFPAFEGRTVESLTGDFAKTREYLEVGSDRGLITAEEWARSLSNMGGWQIPDFDPAGQGNSYAERVDMSYLTEARAGAGA